MTTPTTALMSAIDPWYTGPIVPELQRRRADLRLRLQGATLVLTGPPSALPADVSTGYDHIATIGWLAAAPDLDGALTDLIDRLAPDGWLHSIEPTSGSASVARAQRLASPVGRVRTGWQLGRDIPAAIRRGGLVITDIERFSMPVSSTILRPWAHSRARRRNPGAGSGAREARP